MRIVLAPDSFKGCLSATEVCEAMTDGIRSRLPAAVVESVPMADGGEGTAAVVSEALAGRTMTQTAAGPLGDPVAAAYVYSETRRTAVVESAAACGLPLLTDAQRDPMRTSTRGVGELYMHALAAGAQRIMLTIGGSSTVDGGAGFARALGFRFLDQTGDELPEGGGGLAKLHRIVFPAERPWDGVETVVACDVNNPLLGPNGAAAVFAPQKGARPAQVPILEAGLARLAEVLRRDHDLDVAERAGAGAAGGLGAGLMAFCNGQLESGVDLVMDLVDLRQRLTGADLVITGEGQTDAQTAGGKVCAGIAREAARQGIPCVILSGAIEEPLDELRRQGATSIFSISPGPRPLAAALASARTDVAAAAAEVASLYATVISG